MIGEITLRTESIDISLASVFTSHSLKEKFRLLTLKIFLT